MSVRHNYSRACHVCQSGQNNANTLCQRESKKLQVLYHVLSLVWRAKTKTYPPIKTCHNINDHNCRSIVPTETEIETCLLSMSEIILIAIAKYS